MRSFDIGPTKNPGLSSSIFTKSTSATSLALRLSYAGSEDRGSPVSNFKAISPSIISSSNPVKVTLFKLGEFQFAFNIVIEVVLRLTSSKSPTIDKGIVTSAERRGRVVKLNSAIRVSPSSPVELSKPTTFTSTPTPSRS